MHLIKQRYSGSTTKTEFIEVPKALDTSVIKGMIDKIPYCIGYVENLYLEKSAAKSTIKEMLYELNPEIFIMPKETYEVNAKNNYFHNFYNKNVINTVLYTTANGIKFYAKKCDFNQKEWNELFKLWELYSISNKKLTKFKKEKHAKFADYVSVMKTQDYLNNLIVNDILI